MNRALYSALFLSQHSNQVEFVAECQRVSHGRSGYLPWIATPEPSLPTEVVLRDRIRELAAEILHGTDYLSPSELRIYRTRELSQYVEYLNEYVRDQRISLLSSSQSFPNFRMLGVGIENQPEHIAGWPWLGRVFIGRSRRFRQWLFVRSRLFALRRSHTRAFASLHLR